jgi:hypothetical protein
VRGKCQIIGKRMIILYTCMKVESNGRATAQAVSRRFPTEAVRVRARVRSCGMCGKKSGGTSVSPANLHSTDCSIFTIVYHLGLVQYTKQWPQYQVHSVSPHEREREREREREMAENMTRVLIQFETVL